MDSKVSMNTLMHLNCFEENLVKWHTSEKFWILCQSDLNILHKVLSPTMRFPFQKKEVLNFKDLLIVQKLFHTKWGLKEELSWRIHVWVNGSLFININQQVNVDCIFVNYDPGPNTRTKILGCVTQDSGP